MHELEDKIEINLKEKILEKLDSIKATEVCVSVHVNRGFVFIILDYCVNSVYFEIVFRILKDNLKNDIDYANYVRYLGLNSVFIIEDYLNEKTS